MCSRIGFVTCGPDEALFISGVGYGKEPTRKNRFPFEVT